MTDFSYLNVDNAYKLINHKVTKTPLVTNDYINNLLEAEIILNLKIYKILDHLNYVELHIKLQN